MSISLFSDDSVVSYSGDSVNAILLDVMTFQSRVWFYWSTHSVISLSTGGVYFVGSGDVSETYLADAVSGDSTWLPLYSSYCDLWARGDFMNPFEYDWHDFSSSCLHCVEYLRGVLEILDKQVIMWDVDKQTRDFLDFISFTDFHLALRRLSISCLTTGLPSD